MPGLRKQAEENPITPDTTDQNCVAGVTLLEASRREPDHAGHVSYAVEVV